MGGPELVGQQVECITMDGRVWGRGKVYARNDAPTVNVEREDGSRFSWRADLTRVAPEPAFVTHNHGIDPSCRERLVGECVIEHEVAHAVAAERERIAAWHDEQVRLWRESERDMLSKRVHGMHVMDARSHIVAHRNAAIAIRAGAHNEEVR